MSLSTLMFNCIKLTENLALIYIHCWLLLYTMEERINFGWSSKTVNRSDTNHSAHEDMSIGSGIVRTG